jgi:hypothetical protein
VNSLGRALPMRHAVAAYYRIAEIRDSGFVANFCVNPILELITVRRLSLKVGTGWRGPRLCRACQPLFLDPGQCLVQRRAEAPEELMDVVVG